MLILQVHNDIETSHRALVPHRRGLVGPAFPLRTITVTAALPMTVTRPLFAMISLLSDDGYRTHIQSIEQ